MVNREVAVGARRPPLLDSSDGLLVVASKTSHCSNWEVNDKNGIHFFEG